VVTTTYTIVNFQELLKRQNNNNNNNNNNSNSAIATTVGEDPTIIIQRKCVVDLPFSYDLIHFYDDFEVVLVLRDEVMLIKYKEDSDEWMLQWKVLITWTTQYFEYFIKDTKLFHSGEFIFLTRPFKDNRRFITGGTRLDIELTCLHRDYGQILWQRVHECSFDSDDKNCEKNYHLIFSEDSPHGGTAESTVTKAQVTSRNNGRIILLAYVFDGYDGISTAIYFDFSGNEIAKYSNARSELRRSLQYYDTPASASSSTTTNSNNIHNIYNNNNNTSDSNNNSKWSLVAGSNGIPKGRAGTLTNSLTPNTMRNLQMSVLQYENEKREGKLGLIPSQQSPRSVGSSAKLSNSTSFSIPKVNNIIPTSVTSSDIGSSNITHNSTTTIPSLQKKEKCSLM